MDEQLGALLDRLDALAEKMLRSVDSDEESFLDAKDAFSIHLRNAWPTLSRALRERGWIPVTERLPDGRYNYIGVDVDTHSVAKIVFFQNGNWYLAEHPFNMTEVTHYMPLPSPPKEATQ